VNANVREFLQKLDNLCKEYEFEIVSSTDIDILDNQRGGNLIGFFPSVVKFSEYRDLDNS
jgi:hypothetical protein